MNFAVSSNKMEWESNYRISQDTQPLHYDVYLHPDLKTNTFKGKVNIEIESKTPRKFFAVHVQHLKITKTSLTDDAGKEIVIQRAFEYEPNQFWVVQLDRQVDPGIYFLSLEFNGRLDNGILGFYKSVYVNEKGEERAMATSKFQPTYARRAFPCFDEPSFKSTFTTTLVRPSGDGYIALSNMPEASSKPDTPEPGLTEVTFEKSVPMVTYLAIFVVCDFPYLERTQDNISMKLYGTKKNQPFLEYAAEIGAHIAGFYQSYFGIKYPLPKLDMAAIPDYSSGATEHWGLVTYRETNLVFDPKESSFQNKIRVADVIAHELAHQWFGNLMTVHWWNDLWLNEGFATYIEYKGVKSYETNWDTDSKFLTDDLHHVMDLDATKGSHPIVVDVDTPDQINAVFDLISYSKGASVIRMMEDFMGSANFRQGLQNFLTKFSYKTAVTKDLFDELSQVSGLDVSAIMDTWTRQKGFPVLTLTKSSDGGYVIKQERFVTNPGQEDDPSPFNYKWEIPVTYVTSQNPQEKNQVWFKPDQEQLQV